MAKKEDRGLEMDDRFGRNTWSGLGVEIIQKRGGTVRKPGSQQGVVAPLANGDNGEFRKGGGTVSKR